MTLRGGVSNLEDSWRQFHPGFREDRLRVTQDIREYELSKLQALKSRDYRRPTKSMFGDTTREIIDRWILLGDQEVAEAQELLRQVPFIRVGLRRVG